MRSFIHRVALRNYKSIGYCDVNLGQLTYLVGKNGAGKSNFVDALHFVCDALSDSLEHAIQERGGSNEVRRRSHGHPTHFSICLDLRLSQGEAAQYAFEIGATKDGGFSVSHERCVRNANGKGPYFDIHRGKVDSSESTFPASTSDRLALVAASGMPAFRPVYDVLTAMGFYNLNPRLMRELQKPQDGRLLKPHGENIASVIGHLSRSSPQQYEYVGEYLQTVAPMVHGVERKPIGPMETLEFRQEMAGSKHPWRFLAQNMSDGTLRALGVLTALFQGDQQYPPTLIGIEEPEAALHPAASRALREALRQASSSTQVIVTSHSPELLDDNMDVNELLLVTSENGESRITKVDEAARQTVKDHLFTAGELLSLDQLAPDEGDLERQQQSAGRDLFSGLSL